MGNRKVVMHERSEASMEILDFGPSGHRLLVHFVQDKQQRNAILNVAKNLDNRGMENLTVFRMTTAECHFDDRRNLFLLQL